MAYEFDTVVAGDAAPGHHWPYLARAGLRVCMVGRASFPSDTASPTSSSRGR